MRKSLRCLLAGLTLISSLPTFAIAKKSDAPIILQSAAVEGGRTLQIIVAQSEIKSDINPSNIAAATGYGLLGSLIGAAVDSGKAKKAEELIGPVRSAMADFDVDALAIETARKSFADMEWFRANPSDAFGKDSSAAGKSSILDAAKTKQVAIVEYVYDISPAFDAIRVVAKIDIVNAAMLPKFKGKGERRLYGEGLTYSDTVTSVVLLKNPNKDKDINAPLWAADNAALTRKAMQTALANLVPLTQRSMSLTTADLATLNDKKNKRTSAAGYVGRPQPATNDRSTLLWEGRFINVETIE